VVMAAWCAARKLLNADFDGELIKIRNQFCQPPAHCPSLEGQAAEASDRIAAAFVSMAAAITNR